MRKTTHIIGIFTVVFFSTCKKPDLPKPVPPYECWNKFVGYYIVYDTAAGISYPLTISHFLDTNTSGYYTDFLLFTNFDNQFNISRQFTCYGQPNYLDIGYNTNIPNEFGNHYNIWDQFDDTSTATLENYLFKDTIVFNFRVENTAYWPSEGVPYVDIYKRQIAVKQN